jgi:hypothetical protein
MADRDGAEELAFVGTYIAELLPSKVTVLDVDTFH